LRDIKKHKKELGDAHLALSSDRWYITLHAQQQAKLTATPVYLF
jgi:hypothetical protein